MTQINRVPGVSFLSRKRELGYVYNKFLETYYPNSDRKYFPETYLLPEQLEEYKKVHKVDKNNR